MASKKKFIEEITEQLLNGNINLSDDALEFWNDFIAPKAELTEKGKKILKWMQENEEKLENRFSAIAIGNGTFASSRQVTGSMNSLIKKEYVDKEGKSPVIYSLTDKGKNFVDF